MFICFWNLLVEAYKPRLIRVRETMAFNFIYGNSIGSYNSFDRIMIMRSDRPLDFIFYVQSVYRYHLWPLVMIV